MICPVCKKEYGYLKLGMGIHIVGKAKGEFWLKHHEGLKETPHYDYWIKNRTETKKFILRIKE